MVYKGRLRVAGESGDGIPVDLSIDDVYVDLTAGGEALGRWRMDVVVVSRLASNEFALVLDGEPMVFVAADPLGFAYNAVTTIEEISSRLTKRRGLFRRRAELPREPFPEPSSVVTDVSPSVAMSDLEDLLPPATAPSSGGDEVVEDVAAVSYLSDDVVMIGLNAEPVPSESDESAPVVDGAAPEVDDVVAVEALEPVGTIDPVDASSSVAVSEPVEVSESVETTEPAGTFEQPASLETAELVEAASTTEPAEIGESHEPLHDPDTVEAVTDRRVVEVFGDSQVATPLDSADGETQSDPASQGSLSEVAPAQEAPVASSRPEVPASGEQKRRRFGRTRAEAVHEHEYAESRTVGGITRRVCSHCGHVSFAGVDVYQEWK